MPYTQCARAIFGLFIFLTAILTLSATQPATASGSDDQYYTARPDFRRCAQPLCGGWFVKRVNRKYTQCANAKRQTECYVAKGDLSLLKLTQAQREAFDQAMLKGTALLKGKILPYGAFGNLGQFIVDRAWVGETEQKPTGTFFSVRNNGIRCITDPCESFDARVLNHNHVKDVATLDFSQAQASTEQIEAAQAQANTRTLLLAGKLFQVSGTGGNSVGIAINQFYTQLKGANEPCIITGCSNHICADDDVISTCEWREEYACFQTAECTRQSEGICGWTRAQALIDCLSEARSSQSALELPAQ